MPPVHLAVREGHLEIVRFLAERGAVNPRHKTYPYQETIRMVAEDRGYTAIVEMLDEYGRTADPDRPEDENGEIDYGKDPQRHRFQQLVNANALGAVEALLDQRPELALDPFAFWSEGVLMMPAHDNHWPMIELLMRYGARVPDMTKWCREYYFKHYDTAAFLMERGMNPNHMNCDRTTLLHGMAQLGDVRRATLLLTAPSSTRWTTSSGRRRSDWPRAGDISGWCSSCSIAGRTGRPPAPSGRRRARGRARRVTRESRPYSSDRQQCGAWSQHDSDGSCGSRRRRVTADHCCGPAIIFLPICALRNSSRMPMAE
jgi:hypothetical protein